MRDEAWLLDRFDRAAKTLEAIAPAEFEQNRIERLRQDIDSFRRDLKFLDDGGILILAPDAAEIRSYIEPRLSLGLYCFPLEDRAMFDRVYAKSQRREGDFRKKVETPKIARRILRARAHLFSISRRNLLLPPYLKELSFTLSYILAKRKEAVDLDAVFDAIADNLALLEGDTELLDDLVRFSTLAEEDRLRVLDAVFDKIVASPTDFSDDMSVAERAQRISVMARANDFVLRTRSSGIDEYDWADVFESEETGLIERLHDLTPDTRLVQCIDNLFNKLPRSTRTSFAVYSDARALAYLAAINEELQQKKGRPVRVQLVTWALSPVSVARAFWPEESEPGVPSVVQVRHPKLLAAAIDFRHPNVQRSQVESDLELFSEALSLFEAGGQNEGDATRVEKLAKVRESWEQLDNTLLAWSTPIGKKRTDDAPPARGLDSLEAIRQVVVANRPAFEEYLTKRIDSVSKTLSDAHWSTVVDLEKVREVNADRLQNERGRYIILRSHEDQARFAIALYSDSIVRAFEESVDREHWFGETLYALTRQADGETLLRDADPGPRAETQLLKACLFAIRGDNILAARYCGLAKVELGPGADAYHAGIRAEIFYLDHYAHRCLGIARRAAGAEEFRVCLRRLEASNGEWKRSTLDADHRFRPRYFASWMTTCREIAAVGVTDLKLDGRFRDSASAAYLGCLDLLERYVATFGNSDGLEKYLAGRVTQNVMFVYTFHELEIGSWPKVFGEVIHPTKAHAGRALDVLRVMRASREDWAQGERLGNMKRNDLAYRVGRFWFAATSEERRATCEKLAEMKPYFGGDAAMGLVIDGLLQRAASRAD